MAADEPDFAAAGLLEGLEGAARAERLDLLRQLHAAGVALDELCRAAAEGRLALLPVELALGPPGARTLRQVAEESGLDLDAVAAHRRAAGLPVPDPDEPALGDDDLESARMLAMARAAGIPDEALLDSSRVFGEAAARAANAVQTVVRDALVRPGVGEREFALRAGALAEALAGPTAQRLASLFRSHLHALLRGAVVDAQALATGSLGGAQEVTVAFADLVGFTRLGQTVPPEDLGVVAGRLAALAADVAEAPVRLVKTIGDAAMLVAPAPGELLDAALALVAAAEAEGEDFPLLRAGVAFGAAMPRSGDWYGPPVNLASRLVGIARPSSVLATAAVREACADGYRWSFAGRHRLKGVRGEVPLWRCRRAGG